MKFRVKHTADIMQVELRVNFSSDPHRSRLLTFELYVKDAASSALSTAGLVAYKLHASKSSSEAKGSYHVQLSLSIC